MSKQVEHGDNDEGEEILKLIQRRKEAKAFEQAADKSRAEKALAAIEAAEEEQNAKPVQPQVKPKVKEVRTVAMWNARKQRKTHSEAFKKRLVKESLEEGKSVAMVAWLNHLPAPQLHKWVKKYTVQS